MCWIYTYCMTWFSNVTLIKQRTQLLWLSFRSVLEMLKLTGAVNSKETGNTTRTETLVKDRRNIENWVKWGERLNRGDECVSHFQGCSLPLMGCGSSAMTSCITCCDPCACISWDICTHKGSAHGRKIQLRNYLLYMTELLLQLPEKSRFKYVQIYHRIYGQHLIPSCFSLLYAESQHVFKFLLIQQLGHSNWLFRIDALWSTMRKLAI